jgi:transposase
VQGLTRTPGAGMTTRVGQTSSTVAKAVKEQLELVEQARARPLGDQEAASLSEWIVWAADTLQANDIAIKRLRRLKFSPDESASAVLGEQKGSTEQAQPAQPVESVPPDSCAENPPGKCSTKRKGHGRRCAAQYTGGGHKSVPHPHLKPGDRCPECKSGTLRKLKPAVHVHLHASAPVQSTVVERDRLGCCLCGATFTAPMPHDCRKKYDESVAAVIALLTYWMGVPFNATARLQDRCGIPLPLGTQFDLVNQSAKTVQAVVQEMLRQAANGTRFHNDDTTKKILTLSQEKRDEILGKDKAHRTGVFTSCEVWDLQDGHIVAKYRTGPQHGGENATESLRMRNPALPPPIQMCDALAHNVSKEFETILANCMSHARRQFFDLKDHYEDEVSVVISVLGMVYETDADARKRQLTPSQRLELHREKSRPLMISLGLWMRWLLQSHQVEPNSALGKAFRYIQRHWKKLTKFYRVENAPLDNNLAERALKKAIRHRKNSLFYRTLNGAHVGDTFMTIFHSAELNGANPLHYLVSLLRHPDQINEAPESWMPWNYLKTLADLKPPESAGREVAA